MESLRQKRVRFTRLLAQLIQHINAAGYEVAIDEAKRTREQAALNSLPIPTRKQIAHVVAKAGYPGYAEVLRESTSKGSHRSTHIHGLAADLLLYRGGVWLSKTEDHRVFGTWWESQGPDFCWGGRFSRPDGGHYSIEHEGVK